MEEKNRHLSAPRDHIALKKAVALKNTHLFSKSLFSISSLLLMAVCIIFLLSAGTARGDSLQLAAQLTDTKSWSGTLGIRFSADYDNVDIYITAFRDTTSEDASEYLPDNISEDGSKNSSKNLSEDVSTEMVIFSLEKGQAGWGWTRGVSMLGSRDSIKQGRWITLTDVDFSYFKKYIGKIAVAIVLVEMGKNPFEIKNWLDAAYSYIITNPAEREPGQTFFLSTGDGEKIHPDYVYAPPLADTDGEPEGEDDQNNGRGDVEKPDIYKISGNRLYYANGSAELFQVVDISLPDEPRMVFSRRLENTPLDIYLSNDHVILLEQSWDNEGNAVVMRVFQDLGHGIEEVAGETYKGISYVNSRKYRDIIFMTATSGTYLYYRGSEGIPRVNVIPGTDASAENSLPGVAALPAEDDVLAEDNVLAEDSMPGLDALLAEDNVPVTDDVPSMDIMPPGPVTEPFAIVMAIDVANPAQPALIAKETFSGHDSHIYLHSDYLVQIARDSWNTTLVHVFNLNQGTDTRGINIQGTDNLKAGTRGTDTQGVNNLEAGTRGTDTQGVNNLEAGTRGADTRGTAFLDKVLELKIPGIVPSEYHVAIKGDDLLVIYRDQDIQRGSTLKIYDLTPQEMGREKGAVRGIAPGEELYAATFMEQRAYIVTYERVDPLWVIDISDHYNPKILGELKVPGWSEYIRFHDNRLIALGYDDSDGKRLVSAALFSVEDPYNPFLLDRVTPLQEVADYTSSPAIADDRGFYFNSSSNLVLLPIEYYGYTDYSYHGYSGLGIIKIASDYNSFEWDHFVRAGFSVKRGTEAGDVDDLIIGMGDSAINTIDISSPLKPVVRGELRLSYNVEKIELPYIASDSSSRDDSMDTHGDKRIFAVGGEYYFTASSDLMVFDITDPGFQMNTPSRIIDSGLIHPDIVMSPGKDEGGVLFSWDSSAFRCFDPETMQLGTPMKFDNSERWGTSDILYRNSHLYYSIKRYSPSIDFSGHYTILKGYDCTDMNKPGELPGISIPGTPAALFRDGSLVTVEQFN
ncbi:MAG: beta-propeller domain-containing protein, partial [Desulfamplus sp.]|nr:beta-propeller domain-containing protein [Desulfamplus sp.]